MTIAMGGGITRAGISTNYDSSKYSGSSIVSGTKVSADKYVSYAQIVANDATEDTIEIARNFSSTKISTDIYNVWLQLTE